MNIGLREQGSSSKIMLVKKMLLNMVMLMATWSKKILVLGWAPPDKEDVVENGDVEMIERLCGGTDGTVIIGQQSSKSTFSS